MDADAKHTKLLKDTLRNQSTNLFFICKKDKTRPEVNRRGPYPATSKSNSLESFLEAAQQPNSTKHK